jgi:hypothetical protein
MSTTFLTDDNGNFRGFFFLPSKKNTQKQLHRPTRPTRHHDVTVHFGSFTCMYMYIMYCPVQLACHGYIVVPRDNEYR